MNAQEKYETTRKGCSENFMCGKPDGNCSSITILSHLFDW